MDFDMAKKHYQEGLRMDPEHAGCKKSFRLVKKLVKLQTQAQEAVNHGRHAEAVSLVGHVNECVPVLTSPRPGASWRLCKATCILTLNRCWWYVSCV